MLHSQALGVYTEREDQKIRSQNLRWRVFWGKSQVADVGTKQLSTDRLQELPCSWERHRMKEKREWRVRVVSGSLGGSDGEPVGMSQATEPDDCMDERGR